MLSNLSLNQAALLFVAVGLAGALVGRLSAGGGAMPARGRKKKARPARGNGRSSGDSSSSGSSGEAVEMYVGNLSYEVTERDLTKAFGEHGNVESVRIIKNRTNGKSKGYGFVEVTGSDAAQSAVEALNGREFKGRKMVVNEAKSRARDD